MKTTALDGLAEDLLGEFERDARGRGAAKLLADYASVHRDWQARARFDPSIYTRNLVRRNEQFELLVLCWSPGQVSPIHDHAGEHCWMAVLDGQLEEQQFHLVRPGAGLRAGRAKVFTPGQVAYIEDEIALHRVRPIGEAAVSLHLYARPIDVCSVFEESTGAVLAKQLIYHSVGT
jgi:cysteine dioxygenase